MKKKFIKASTIALVIITIIVMLFSALYITSHVDHDCTGAECQICQEIILCSENIKLIVAASIILCSFFLIHNGFMENVHTRRSFFTAVTPVSQNIQLNN